mgnify:FL=1
MAELSPEFIATAKRMGVPLPPRHRPRFFSSVRSYFRRRIDWTGALTGQRQPQHYPSKRAEQLDRLERLECLARINRNACR